MNKVILIGNLTRDPELSTTPSGVALCKFSLAVQRRFANSEGERDVDFFNIVAWRTQAENCHRFLKKGNKAGIVGQIQNRSYEDKDGIKRYATDIIAEEVEFLSPKSEAHNSPEPDERPSKKAVELKPIIDDDLPF